jgi:hypothetical protein
MSAMWNGRATWTPNADSMAERLGRIIDNGVKKLGLVDLRALRVDPTKLKDLIRAQPERVERGGPSKRLDLFPDVRGMTVAEIVAKHGVDRRVAGRVLAMQSMQQPKGEAAK